MKVTIRAAKAAAAWLLALGLGFSAAPASAGDHLFKKHKTYKVVEGYLIQPQAAAPSAVLVQLGTPAAGNAANTGSDLASASPQSGQAKMASAPAGQASSLFNPAMTAAQLNLSALANLPATTAPATTFQFASAPTQVVQFAAAPVQFAAAPVQFAAAPVQFAAAPVQFAAAPVQFAAAPLVQTTTSLAVVPAAAPAAGLTPVQVLVPKHSLLPCFGFGH